MDFLNSARECHANKMMCPSGHKLILGVHETGVCPCLLPVVLLQCPTMKSLALCSWWLVKHRGLLLGVPEARLDKPISPCLPSQGTCSSTQPSPWPYPERVPVDRYLSCADWDRHTRYSTLHEVQQLLSREREFLPAALSYLNYPIIL